MNITTLGGRQTVVLDGTTNYVNPMPPAAHGHTMSLPVLAIGDGMILRKEGDIVVLSVDVNLIKELLAPYVKDMQEDIGALIERVDEMEAE